jgi:hypothetical protein
LNWILNQIPNQIRTRSGPDQEMNFEPDPDKFRSGTGFIAGIGFPSGLRFRPAATITINIQIPNALWAANSYSFTCTNLPQFYNKLVGSVRHVAFCW